ERDGEGERQEERPREAGRGAGEATPEEGAREDDGREAEHVAGQVLDAHEGHEERDEVDQHGRDGDDEGGQHEAARDGARLLQGDEDAQRQGREVGQRRVGEEGLAEGLGPDPRGGREEGLEEHRQRGGPRGAHEEAAPRARGAAQHQEQHQRVQRRAHRGGAERQERRLRAGAGGAAHGLRGLVPGDEGEEDPQEAPARAASGEAQEEGTEGAADDGRDGLEEGVRRQHRRRGNGMASLIPRPYSSRLQSSSPTRWRLFTAFPLGPRGICAPGITPSPTARGALFFSSRTHSRSPTWMAGSASVMPGAMTSAPLFTNFTAPMSTVT